MTYKIIVRSCIIFFIWNTKNQIYIYFITPQFLMKSTSVCMRKCNKYHFVINYAVVFKFILHVKSYMIKICKRLLISWLMATQETRRHVRSCNPKRIKPIKPRKKRMCSSEGKSNVTKRFTPTATFALGDEVLVRASDGFLYLAKITRVCIVRSN